MRYLIDGHNLIPKLGLRLQDFEDEQELMERLQEFCRLQRAQAEVYFDNAPPGFPEVRRFGAVTAHFIRRGITADAALEARLLALGKQARRWVVVSSDRRVQAAAQAVHALVLSSEVFAKQMKTALKRQVTSEKPEALKPEEIEEWLSLFKTRKG
ncbi:MAG: NYN domain-containing protein [Anaerolineales bacterium]|nr:NYN domain-containing protein [Anaerolineales bacterium]